VPRFGEVTTLVPHTEGSITAFVRTRDGFATIADDQQLRTFDSSGALRAGKKAGSGGMIRIVALAARPDGAAVLTGTTKIAAYDAVTAKPGLQLKGHGSKTEVTSLVYLRDGRTLASAALVNLPTKANSVCLWSDDGTLLHTVLLDSGRPKSPCQPQALVRAPSTDTLFAVGWAPASADDPAIAPARHLFRIDAGTLAVTRIATLTTPDPLVDTQVLGIVATDDRVFLSLHTTRDVPSRDMRERTWITELRALDFDGRTVASDASEPQSIQSAVSPRRALAVSSDGALLAAAAGGVELRASASLALLDRLGEPHFAEALSFDGDALLFATSQGIHRVAVVG
jgi:hypothetical protein